MNYLNALKSLLGNATETVIFDVGAHHGETERIFSENFSNSSIYCFEPFDASFSILKKNVSENTKIFNVGLSDCAGNFEFQSNFYDPTNSLLALEKNAKITWGVEGLEQREEVNCEFVTLDEFVVLNKIEKIDLLKLDVQGAEFKVLIGAKNSLRNKAIKILYMEIIIAPTYLGQWGLEKYIAELSLCGYELYGIYNMVYGGDDRLLQVDAIFSLPNI